MDFLYIGSEGNFVDLAEKLGVTLEVLNELSIDQRKAWEDTYENSLINLYQKVGQQDIYGVYLAKINNQIGVILETQTHHPYPFKDGYWRELKYYIGINP